MRPAADGSRWGERREESPAGGASAGTPEATAVACRWGGSCAVTTGEGRADKRREEKVGPAGRRGPPRTPGAFRGEADRGLRGRGLRRFHLGGVGVGGGLEA